MPESDWTPTTKQVAAYIPTRTRSIDNPGSDQLSHDFSSTTTPTDGSVKDVFVPGAVAVVSAAVGPVPAALYALALQAAALRAAADIELAYPERDADLQVYRDLDARAKLALDRLIGAVGDTGGGPDATVPVWAMPCPPRWGDLNL